MSHLAEEELTSAVLAQLSNCKDDRLRSVMEALVRHLHQFVREVEPTQDEWMEGIRFLTRTGQTCNDRRQEYILLSDTLGVSMLVDAINNRKPKGATPSSVLGPFYLEGAPQMTSVIDLAPGEGPGVVVRGSVKDIDGRVLPGAVLDVWQSAPNGLYHMQDGDQREFHLCAPEVTRTWSPTRSSASSLRSSPNGRARETIGRWTTTSFSSRCRRPERRRARLPSACKPLSGELHRIGGRPLMAAFG